MRILTRATAKKYLPLVILLSITFVFWYITPDAIVSYVGSDNAYYLIFILAFLGGVTTFSGIPYHAVLVALALGGLNPWILGPLTAVAVTIGDCTSYLVGYYGREVFPERIVRSLERVSHLRDHYPRLVPVAIFLYGALIPTSSDIVTIPMGIIRYPMHRVLIPLALGTVIFNTGLALLAVYASEYLTWIL